MKLMFCPRCADVQKLSTSRVRRCECGRSWGYYRPDGLNAEIGGDAIPLGFVNASLAEAVRNRPESGKGERFTAFVIPRSAPRVREMGAPDPPPQAVEALFEAVAGRVPSWRQ